MTLYLVGLGLWDEKDMSLKAREISKKCDEVYLEYYTSVLFGTSKEKLEKEIGKEIILLDRKAMEQDKPYLENAKQKAVAVLIGGDPLSATTHMETILEAKRSEIQVELVHASSIFTAVAECGLFLYKFGKTCSLPFWSKNYKPTSFYDIIKDNLSVGAHTLMLLDIKADEKRFMTVNEALELLLKVSKNDDLDEETYVVGLSRLGSPDRQIVYGKIKELLTYDFKGPMHVVIVPGKLNDTEKEALEMFKLS